MITTLGECLLKSRKKPRKNTKKENNIESNTVYHTESSIHYYGSIHLTFKTKRMASYTIPTRINNSNSFVLEQWTDRTDEWEKNGRFFPICHVYYTYKKMHFSLK